jgi:hypothetical protein
MSTELEKAYFNLSSPAGLGGFARIKNSLPNQKAKDIKEFLKAQDTYTRHKQRFGKFRRRKVTAPGRNYLWQADVIFMQKYKNQNKKFAYLLSVVDVFSKYGFCIPLKKKTASEIVRGFEEIFKNYRGKPRFLQCDEGREFFNVKFKNFLDWNGVTLYHNFSEFKACVVERFNRTILNRISKYFTHTGKKEYISVLPQLIHSYNTSKHRTIGCTPKDVNRYNEMDIWLYANRDLYTKQCKKPKLKQYDHVRFCKKREIFEKGYRPSYTDEIFEISEVIDSIPPTFKLSELSGTQLNGIFYEQELVHV